MSAREKRRLELRVMDENAKGLIRDTFEDLEHRLGIEGMGTVLTTAILELVENAVKANLKRAFFQKNNYRLDDRGSYEAGIQAFVRSYGDIKGDSYREALRSLNLVVSVDVDTDARRLLIYVRNNTILLATEEKRIRKQLAAAMTSEKFEEFYINFGDETEGSGLGLAMIVFLVRTLGFNPGHFRVFRGDGTTTARLEFPMRADYIPLRERWEREQGASNQNA